MAAQQQCRAGASAARVELRQATLTFHKKTPYSTSATRNPDLVDDQVEALAAHQHCTLPPQYRRPIRGSPAGLDERN
jgi:hypothetical protein